MSAERYAEAVGAEALARQQAEADRCSYCWAPPGEPHHPICPNRDPEDEAAPPGQDEALF